MKDLFFIILFLLPGVIVMCIQNYIIGGAGHKKSDLEKTVEGIFLSIPCLVLTLFLIILVNWIFVRYFSGAWWIINSIDQLVEWVNSFKHLVLYLFLSVISSLIIGFLLARLKKPNGKLLKLINFFRVKHEKANLSGYDSVWDELTEDDKELVVEIKTKDGNAKKGFIKSSSSNSDKYREITLEGFDRVKKFQGYFEDETLVFINIDSGTVITAFDMTAYNDYIDKIKKAQNDKRKP